MMIWMLDSLLLYRNGPAGLFTHEYSSPIEYQYYLVVAQGVPSLSPPPPPPPPHVKMSRLTQVSGKKSEKKN